MLIPRHTTRIRYQEMYWHHLRYESDTHITFTATKTRKQSISLLVLLHFPDPWPPLFNCQLYPIMSRESSHKWPPDQYFMQFAQVSGTVQTAILKIQGVNMNLVALGANAFKRLMHMHGRVYPAQRTQHLKMRTCKIDTKLCFPADAIEHMARRSNKVIKLKQTFALHYDR